MFTDVSLALTPSICFVGCQCQVYVLRKAIAPLGTQQASENGDFYLQNYHNYKISNSSFRSHGDPQHLPLSKKKVKLLPFGISQPLLSIPVAFINHKLSFGPTVHIILPQNLKQLYSFCVLVTLVLCPEIGSSNHKLSISRLRSTGNVHKLCIDITYTSLSVSPCKWHLLHTFW